MRIAKTMIKRKKMVDLHDLQELVYHYHHHYYFSKFIVQSLLVILVLVSLFRKRD